MGSGARAKDWPFIPLHRPEFESVLAGAHSKVPVTAVLTWNSAFVPDCAPELLSKPHILPCSPTGVFSFLPLFFFLHQAGIKQNGIRAIESPLIYALVAWSAEITKARSE